MLMAKIQLMDRGVIAPEDVRMTLRKAGEIEREEEDIIGDSEAVSPV
jgi:hypothetical protein